MQNKISERVERAISDKVFPGCVVGIVRKNGERLILPFGHFTYDSDSPVVREDTIYDVASITKSIPTATLALILIDQGKLRLTDKLIDYIPEFNNSDRADITIRHLLAHTMDGYGLAQFKDQSADELLHTIFTRDFEKKPGTVFNYSNLTSLLLGLVIERIMGNSLDKLAEEYLFKPLGMTRSTFSPENFPIEEIVPTEVDDWRGLVQGIVHDESAYVFKKAGRVVGHAGLFSTAGDILKFLEMLLNRGTLGGKQYLSANAIEQMSTNQISEFNDSAGLGWELNKPRFMGKYCGPHTFGKTGFTGVLCVCYIEKEIAYVILSNRIYPKRPPNSSAINSVRADLGDIILAI